MTGGYPVPAAPTRGGSLHVEGVEGARVLPAVLPAPRRRPGPRRRRRGRRLGRPAAHRHAEPQHGRRRVAVSGGVGHLTPAPRYCGDEPRDAAPRRRRLDVRHPASRLGGTSPHRGRAGRHRTRARRDPAAVGARVRAADRAAADLSAGRGGRHGGLRQPDHLAADGRGRRSRRRQGPRGRLRLRSARHHRRCSPGRSAHGDGGSRARAGRVGRADGAAGPHGCRARPHGARRRGLRRGGRRDGRGGARRAGARQRRHLRPLPAGVRGRRCRRATPLSWPT